MIPETGDGNDVNEQCMQFQMIKVQELLAFEPAWAAAKATGTV